MCYSLFPTLHCFLTLEGNTLLNIKFFFIPKESGEKNVLGKVRVHIEVNGTKNFALGCLFLLLAPHPLLPPPPSPLQSLLMSYNATTYSPSHSVQDLDMSTAVTISTIVVITGVWCLIALCCCILCYRGQAVLDWIGACCGGSSYSDNQTLVRNRKEVITMTVTSEQKTLIGEFVHHDVEIRLFPHNYNPQSVYKNTLLASTLNNYLSTIFSLYPVA